MQLGDKVQFLNEQGGGIITAIKLNGIVGVTIEDDFEIEMLKSELVVVEPAIKRDINKTTFSAEKEKTPLRNDFGELKNGTYWIVIKDKTEFNLYVFNQNNFPILFAVYLKNLNHIQICGEGKLQPGDLTNIIQWHESKFPDLSEAVLQQITLRNLPASLPHVKEYSFKLSNVLNQASHRIVNQNPTWLFYAEGSQVQEIIEEQSLVRVSEKQYFGNTTRPSEIVDLHAEKLGIDENSGHVVQLQIEHFQKQLELAIAYRMPKITFIHGIGSGVLKNLMQISIKGNKHVKKVLPADEQEFGKGATVFYL